jgi:hypothetical protein
MLSKSNSWLLSKVEVVREVLCNLLIQSVKGSLGTYRLAHLSREYPVG